MEESSVAAETRTQQTAAMEGKSSGPPPDMTPQRVQRLHAIYEELGRKEVLAVQEWEEAEPKTDTKPDAKAELAPEPKAEP